MAAKRCILSILVENKSGVLRRVSNLFSRRGYNIESLSVGVTEDEGVSRITVVAVDCDENIIDQITKQVFKLIEVIKVEILDESKTVMRELQLIKVKTTKQTRAEILEIANIFRSRVVDVSSGSLVLEATGGTQKINALINMLKPFTILEIVRTGLAAIERGEKPLKEEK